MPDLTNDPGVGLAQARRALFPHRYVVLVVVLVPLAVLAAMWNVTVVATAWNTCEVASNVHLAVTRVFPIHFPVMVLTYVGTLFGGHLIAGRPGEYPGFVVLITVVLVAGISWGYFAYAGLPLQNEFCPDGQPSWWPWQLPPYPGTSP